MSDEHSDVDDDDKLSPESARDRRRKAGARTSKYGAGGVPPRGQVPIKSNHSWRMSTNHYNFPVEVRQGEEERTASPPNKPLFAFVRDRLDEWEEQYSTAPDVYRAELADVAAKRAIVTYVEQTLSTLWSFNKPPWTAINCLNPVVPLLALSFADHPDYREEWRP